jgi:hypothetical protein
MSRRASMDVPAPGAADEGHVVSFCPWAFVALAAAVDIAAGLVWLLDCCGILKQLDKRQAELWQDRVARQLVSPRQNADTGG